MTDTQAPEQTSEVVEISVRMGQIITHMLGNARGKYHCAGIAAALGINSGTVQPLLRRMESYGWLVTELETPEEKAARPNGGGSGTGTTRIYYRFTPGTAAQLRRALR